MPKHLSITATKQAKWYFQENTMLQDNSLMKEYDENEIKKDLKIDAHALGIPEGAAETFINNIN